MNDLRVTPLIDTARIASAEPIAASLAGTIGRELELALKADGAELPKLVANLAAILRVASSNPGRAREKPSLRSFEETEQFSKQLLALPEIAKQVNGRTELSLDDSNIDRLLATDLVKNDPLAFVSTILHDVDPTYTNLNERSLSHLAGRLGQLEGADGRVALALSELSRQLGLRSGDAVIASFFGDNTIHRLLDTFPAPPDEIVSAQPLDPPDGVEISVRRDMPGGIYSTLADRFADHRHSFGSWSELREAAAPFGISFSSDLPRLSPEVRAQIESKLRDLFTASESASRSGASMKEDVPRSLLEHVMYASRYLTERSALGPLLERFASLEQEINRLAELKLIDASGFRSAMNRSSSS
jgi:hypothetical protein